MALMFAIWSPQPNWMPRKPKLMFQTCQKPSRGLSMGPSANAGMLLHRTVGELWTVGEAHRPRERRLDLLRGGRPACDFRVPGQTEDRPALVAIPAYEVPSTREQGDVLRR